MREEKEYFSTNITLGSHNHPMKLYLLALDGAVIARVKRIAESMLGEDGHEIVATRDILVLEIAHDKQFVTLDADLER